MLSTQTAEKASSRSTAAAQGASTGAIAPRVARLAVPLVLVLLALLYPLETGRSFESRIVLPILNLVFLTGVPLLVAIRSARSVRIGAPLSVLFLGTGMLALGLASLLAAAALLAGFGPNAMVTVHNIGAFIAGDCVLASAVLAAGSIAGRARPKPMRDVAFSYLGAVLIVAAAYGGAVRGVLPAFIENGQPTAERQLVLGLAVAIMAMAAALLRFQRGRTPEPFLGWYSSGLGLIAVGLMGVLLPVVVGGPVSWLGRAAQYLGCVYLFVAVRSVRDNLAYWPIPLEQILRETSDRYRVLVEMCPEGIIVHSGGRIVFANPAALRLYRAACADDLLGRDVRQMIAASAWNQVSGRIDGVYGGNPSPLAEVAIRRLDGTDLPVETTAALVEYDGEPAVLVVLRDIEERRRAEAVIRDREERLERQAAELAEANRLKDEFLATLSHELRTPLNAIVGWSQMLLGDRLDQSASRHAIEVIARNARVQTNLISDVLDVSRIISGKLTLNLRRVEVEECLRSALDSIIPAAAAKRITVYQHITPGVEVLADPDRLQQVLWNLLSNAVKFTNEAGELAISVTSTDGWAELEVRDNGIGIDSAFLPHVFERFRQADGSATKRHAGLGLGLAIVRHLVELHGGQVTADSPGLGRGASFRIRLPLATVTQAAADGAPQSAPGVASASVLLGGVRILAVDDEPDARDLLMAILQGRGAAVRVAATAAEALDVLHEWQVDLVLTDLGMPIEDGYDLIRKIRALPSALGGRTPAVALTAYGHVTDRARVLAAGFDEHLSKPVVPDELVRVVASLVRKP